MKIELSKVMKYMSFSAFVTYYWKNNTLYEDTGGRIYAYYPVFMGGWSMIMTNPSSFGTVTAGIAPKVVRSVPAHAMSIAALSPNAVAMYKVNSSNIAAIGYDVSNLKLYIEYKSGKTYEYDNVTPNMWNALINVDSKGSWVAWFLKINDGDYPYRIYNGTSLYYTTAPIPNRGTPHANGYMTNF